MTQDDRSQISRLLAWIVVGVVALIALRLLFGILGFAAFVLLKVGPLLLVGWLLLRAWRYFAGPAREA